MSDGCGEEMLVKGLSTRFDQTLYCKYIIELKYGEFGSES